MKLIQTRSRLGEKERHFQKALQFEGTSITVIQLREGEVMAEHSTQADAVIIGKEGQVAVKGEKEEFTLTPDSLLYIEPGELHSLTALQDSEVLLLQIKR